MSSGRESDPHDEPRPRKKVKTEAKVSEKHDTEKGEDIVATSPEARTEQESPAQIKASTNSGGDSYIELGKQKRITISKFKGKVLIDIREYYGKPGEEKPGKKGISLTVEQWETLQSASDELSGLIEQMK